MMGDTATEPRAGRAASSRERVGRAWYRFSKNPLSIVGLAMVGILIVAAVFAPLIAPYPEHAGRFVDFANANQSPSAAHIFGTDNVGRDVFSRVLFALRSALLMGIVVLGISVPVGTVMGLVAGYFQGTLIDSLITRITDIFLAVPPLILALVVASLLKPNLLNAMLAITVTWWTWYSRLVYGMATSIKREWYVRSSQLSGASWMHTAFVEILPNCLSPVLTKMTLDMGFVIMMGASLSFVGLGEQPPAPALGTMIADGAKYMPTQWWLTVFPALTIMVIVLAFNLFGDSFRDLFSTEEK
jgi:peptide/nickel transport system permease protein